MDGQPIHIKLYCSFQFYLSSINLLCNVLSTLLSFQRSTFLFLALLIPALTCLSFSKGLSGVAENMVCCRRILWSGLWLMQGFELLSISMPRDIIEYRLYKCSANLSLTFEHVSALILRLSACQFWYHLWFSYTYHLGLYSSLHAALCTILSVSSGTMECTLADEHSTAAFASTIPLIVDSWSSMTRSLRDSLSYTVQEAFSRYSSVCCSALAMSSAGAKPYQCANNLILELS